jgi:hypothetical protein
MNPDQFVKVFDVLDSGYRNWELPGFGLTFVVVGIGVALFSWIIKLTGIPFFDFELGRWRAFRRYGMLMFAILSTGVMFLATYSQHSRHRTLAQENRCLVVQGPVEHFVPIAVGGNADESFSVAGVPFHYSDFGPTMTDAFNNTVAYGGPVRSDSYVGICYDPADHAILRLEIRGFTGELKDYAKPSGFFSSFFGSAVACRAASGLLRSMFFAPAIGGVRDFAAREAARMFLDHWSAERRTTFTG